MKSPSLITAAALLLLLSSSSSAQKQKNKPVGPLLTRTIARHETARLAFGGTLTLSGAPAGSIVVEGWQRSEVDVSATIELQAPTTADFDRLAPLNTYYVDEDSNHVRILTTGTHDRVFMKRAAKNFPKALLGLPWKVEYRVKVPALTDLVIDSGVGPVTVSGVEGAIRLNSLSGDADLTLTGGLVSVLVQSGTVNVKIPSRGWRGLGAEIRVASGKLILQLASGFSGDINAGVLRGGEITNRYQDLQPREKNGISAKSVRARAGNGGATLNFTVGDGTIEIKGLSD